MKKTILSAVLLLLILTPAVILGETNNGNPENSSGSSDRIIENAESENINKDNSGKDIEEAPKNNNINENANDPVDRSYTRLIYSAVLQVHAKGRGCPSCSMLGGI